MYYISGGESKDRAIAFVRMCDRPRARMYVYIRILRFSRLGRRCGVPCWRRREKIIIKSKIHIAFSTRTFCVISPTHTFHPSPGPPLYHVCTLFDPSRSRRRTRRMDFILLSASVRARSSREIEGELSHVILYVRCTLRAVTRQVLGGCADLKRKKRFLLTGHLRFYIKIGHSGVFFSARKAD